jgi:hypothetical protein
MLKAHRLVFDNKKEVVPFMLRFLDQSQEVAERSYELLVASLSRNGEITDQEWKSSPRRSGRWKRSETLLCCARRGRSSRSVSAMYVRWVLGKSGKDRSEIMPARYSDSWLFRPLLRSASSSSISHLRIPNRLVGFGSLSSFNQPSMVRFETPKS